jgi:two-component system, cell cycle response regulator
MDFTLATPIGAHVLIVDDEPSVARAIARTVTQLGHRATTVHTWTEALRVFNHDDVDLVLMDAVMPVVDGFKLTRMLRGRSESYVPILFLTALSDHASRNQGIAAGADDFISKPCDPLELRARLTAMLRIRWLTRDLEDKTRALSRLASVDALTAIGNRRAFDAQLASHVERAKGSSSPVSLLLLDIDLFKSVNDTYGHAVGDGLLSLFGKLLRETTRACDMPFRYGGEEFAVLCPGTPPQEAVAIGERIRNRFCLRSREATRGDGCTVSVGLCGSDQLDADFEPATLVKAADAALYRAKQEGRNCTVRFEPRLDADLAA